MSERYDAILRLLDTRFDNLPDGMQSRATHSSGFVHGKATVSCDDCLANGRRIIGCASCGGSGYITVSRNDPYSESNDLHTVKVLPHGFGETIAKQRARDAELARLAAQTREPFASPEDELAEANKHPFSWEHARHLMYKLFDYAALDVAVDALQKTHPGVSPRSNRGLDFIERHMPDPIRSPAPPVESEAA